MITPLNVSIGDPIREYTVTPVREPVPETLPAPEREPEHVPETPVPDREPVPA